MVLCTCTKSWHGQPGQNHSCALCRCLLPLGSHFPGACASMSALPIELLKLWRPSSEVAFAMLESGASSWAVASSARKVFAEKTCFTFQEHDECSDSSRGKVG